MVTPHRKPPSCQPAVSGPRAPAGSAAQGVRRGPRLDLGVLSNTRMTASDTETFLASPQLRARDGDLFNIDAALTEEERAVRDSVRAFVDEKVLPIIGQCYVDGRFPKELIEQLGEHGYLGANLPEE